MTFDLSAPTQGSRTRFDSGPLSWVIDEIRDALNQSRLAVQSAIGKDSESSTTLLNQAGAYLHQAHGALQIVDVDGAIIITASHNPKEYNGIKFVTNKALLTNESQVEIIKKYYEHS